MFNEDRNREMSPCIGSYFKHVTDKDYPATATDDLEGSSGNAGLYFMLLLTSPPAFLPRQKLDIISQCLFDKLEPSPNRGLFVCLSVFVVPDR